MNKRILVFIDWYRPGYRAGGPQTSVANLVEHLAGRPAAHPAEQRLSEKPGEVPDHLEFYILTRNVDFMDRTPYKDIEANSWTKRGEGVRVCYLSPGQLNAERLRTLAREANCDTWYINGVYSWYFSILPLLLSRRFKPSRVLVAPRGMLSPHALKQKTIKKNLFLRAARTFRLYRGVHFHATNQAEAEAIMDSLGAKVRVRIAPNLPAKTLADPLPSAPKIPGSLKLLSLARISPEKNTLQAIRILSHLGSGQVSLNLVGEIGPADYWQNCKALIRQLPSCIGVNYEGPLPPEELPRIFKESHMLFLPTTGENHGHAILECLSYGLPALISDQTPWQDLQDHNAGWALPLEREEDFVAILEKCLVMDQEEYAAKSRAARHYARKRSADPRILQMNQNLFASDENPSFSLP